MRQIIKNGFLLNKREFYLSLVVFAYSIISFSIISRYSNSPFLIYLLLFFFFAEIYLNVSIYYGISQSIRAESLKLPEVFINGRRFFARVLWYKIISLLFALVVFAFCLGMIELIKEAPLITAGFITAFTVIWISFPIYLFLLTVYTPLVIVSDNLPLLTAIKTSMVFIKNNLGRIITLLAVFLPLWGFALLLLMLYNETDFIFHIGIFYFVSVLEVITVKVFLIFYKGDRQGNV